MRWALLDGETGEQLDERDIAIKEGPGADDLVHWRLSQGGRGRQGSVDDHTLDGS